MHDRSLCIASPAILHSRYVASPMVLVREAMDAKPSHSLAIGLGLALALALPHPAFATPPQSEAPPAEPAPSAAPVVADPNPAPAPAPDPNTSVPAPVYEAPASQPGPPPAHPQPLPNRNRGLGLMIAGFSVFGFSYLISAVSGTIMLDANRPEIGQPLLIPAAGPFLAASRARTAVGGFGLGFVGVIQIAGLGMGIGGTIMFARARHQAKLSAGPGGLTLRF